MRVHMVLEFLLETKQNQTCFPFWCGVEGVEVKGLQFAQLESDFKTGVQLELTRISSSHS